MRLGHVKDINGNVLTLSNLGYGADEHCNLTLLMSGTDARVLLRAQHISDLLASLDTLLNKQALVIHEDIMATTVKVSSKIDSGIMKVYIRVSGALIVLDEERVVALKSLLTKSLSFLNNSIYG